MEIKRLEIFINLLVMLAMRQCAVGFLLGVSMLCFSPTSSAALKHPALCARSAPLVSCVLMAATKKFGVIFTTCA
jgi:hypothetical protein